MKVERTKFVGGKEGLRILADRLDALPPGGILGVFIWDFMTAWEPADKWMEWGITEPALSLALKSHGCGTVGCAYGYCHTFWPSQFPGDGFIEEMVRAFHIDEVAAATVFGSRKIYCKDYSEITPQDVAKAIRERLL